MDSAVGRTGSHSHYGPGMRGEPVDPRAGGDGLPGRRVGSQRGPVAFDLVGFIRDGTLDDQDERIDAAFGGLVETEQKFVAILRREKWIMKMDFGRPRNSPVHNILETRLRGRGHR